MLVDMTGRDKVQVAIERLRTFEPPEGYWLAYSGGKDSDTILALAKMAGVKFEAHYSITSVDPPEVLRHIKTHPEVQRDFPGITMWDLIVREGFPPTRCVRYCCEALKEISGKGRVNILGLRWAESTRRKKNRRVVEQCSRTGKRTVNPILEWENEDVWEFLHSNRIPYCVLYDQGFDRLGCVGCPINSTTQVKELERWPFYKTHYIRAFAKMLEAKCSAGRPSTMWKTGQDVYDWWIDQSGRDKPLDGQTEIDWPTGLEEGADHE